MTQRDDKVYLQDILEAISRIETYTTGASYESFLTNNLLQDGVIRQLEIIGEASRNLTDALRANHPQVPWRRIIGMRNRIMHVYFSVDLLAVWDTVQVDLDRLKTQVQDILQEL